LLLLLPPKQPPRLLHCLLHCLLQLLLVQDVAGLQPT
jgi:hypothetical protein